MVTEGEEIGVDCEYSIEKIHQACDLLYGSGWTDDLIRATSDRALTEKEFMTMTKEERQNFKYEGTPQGTSKERSFDVHTQ
eukprot:6784160-Prorocentrum_lima.AAC.1